MAEASRRVSTFLSCAGSAPQARAPLSPATPSASAGPLSPRRSILARAASVLALGCAYTRASTASAIPCPDAGLLRLCAAFHELDQASHATDDASWEAHLDRRNELQDAIEDMVPVSDAGRLAKARVALVVMIENADEGDAHQRFTVAALRDLVRA